MVTCTAGPLEPCLTSILSGRALSDLVQTGRGIGSGSSSSGWGGSGMQRTWEGYHPKNDFSSVCRIVAPIVDPSLFNHWDDLLESRRHRGSDHTQESRSDSAAAVSDQWDDWQPYSLPTSKPQWTNSVEMDGSAVNSLKRMICSCPDLPWKVYCVYVFYTKSGKI